MPKQEFNKKRPAKVQDEFSQKLLEVRRVTKVVKGGRTMRFAACVVVGDLNGRVGMGTGKAAEVPVAVEKAAKAARKNAFKVIIDNGTIPHQLIGKYATSTVLMLPTKVGNGIIAGGAARSVVELAGYKDITTKIHGSTNKLNTARATLNALKNMRSKEETAALRGIAIEEI